jgi:hypothetical protein
VGLLVHARDRDRALARALVRALARDRDLALALDRTRGKLTGAANDFVGADLTAADPAQVSLDGIRWDSGTRWPTPEWTARIRRASVEDPPGSGVFIVLPEEGHDFVDRGAYTLVDIPHVMSTAPTPLPVTTARETEPNI